MVVAVQVWPYLLQFCIFSVTGISLHLVKGAHLNLCVITLQYMEAWHITFYFV